MEEIKKNQGYDERIHGKIPILTMVKILID